MSKRRLHDLWIVPLFLVTSACVFPSSSVSGVELSWLFVEGNEVDDDRTTDDEDAEDFVVVEDSRRVRTCAGYGADQVEIFIQDADNEDRQGRFAFPCADGFQTPQEFQLDSSDVFIDLHPGGYDFVATVFPDRSIPLLTDERAVSVSQRSITVLAWDFVPDLATWHLRLSGLDSCDTLALRLLYDDTLAQLIPTHPPDDDDDDDDELSAVVYRHHLASTAGLSLGGRPIACSALNQSHAFEDVDPGDYRLEVTVDDRRCTLPVTIQTDDDPFMLDLAGLPCPG